MQQVDWEDSFFHHHSHPESGGEAPVSAPERRPGSYTRALSAFAQDLLARAKNNELDPLIGRERELERVIQILNRRTKRNPILVGDPGVGKTAIIYGLAQKIAAGAVPLSLRSKHIYALNVSLLLAGAMFRGDFEARLEAVIKEIKKQDAILFIDEIHNIVGAGSVIGTMDAANILKPALAEGAIQVIGSTTFEEYKFYIENDKALERRFQPVFVGEPSLKDSVEVLAGLKSRYEDFHHLKIRAEAIEAAVRLSDRYVKDRYLPDKALDVLDEACAVASVSRDSSKEIQKIEALRSRSYLIREKKDENLRQGRYEEAFRLKKEEGLLLKRASALQKTIGSVAAHVAVGEDDVRKVVSRMTGIPIEEVSSVELRKLKTLEKELCAEVIGQEEAIKALASIIKRSRVGLNFQSRPLGSFVFVGPSGVGKTELARVLARKVFGQDSFIKLDMSEFMEPHSVSRLIGAPAGYIGYGRGGELTEKVRRNPYSLVLFDEAEKAHPQLFNLLLQILEDGKLSDAAGLEVNFKDTIIILTSNLGAEEFSRERREIGFGTGKKEAMVTYDAIKEEALASLRHSFRPEFLNRIDDVIVFRPLVLEHIRSIAELQMKQLAGNAEIEKQLHITYTPNLIDWIAGKAFHPYQGARLVRKTIEKKIADFLAELLISHPQSNKKHLALQVKNDNVAVR